MKTNNISNTGFKGAFILRPQSAPTREAIPNIIKKGRQLFYNIKKEGDVVIVTKNKYDSKIRDFIENEKIQFTYYPEISTKSGLDDQEPSKLKRLLNINNNCVIKSLPLLNKFLDNKPHLCEQSKYIHETLNTLRLNVEDAKIEIDDKGIFTIRDDAHKRTLKSTGFRSGMTYVFVRPDSVTQSIQRFLIGKNGKEVIKKFETPNEMLAFNRAFRKAIKS